MTYHLTHKKLSVMETKGIVIICVFFGAFLLFIGYLWGNSKRGHMVYATNELPYVLYFVVFTNKTCTVLREIGIKERHFLVSTKVFGGKPIRPSDEVRVIKSDRERRDLGIPVLGFPPFVKNVPAKN